MAEIKNAAGESQGDCTLKEGVTRGQLAILNEDGWFREFPVVVNQQWLAWVF